MPFNLANKIIGKGLNSAFHICLSVTKHSMEPRCISVEKPVDILPEIFHGCDFFVEFTKRKIRSVNDNVGIPAAGDVHPVSSYSVRFALC